MTTNRKELESILEMKEGTDRLGYEIFKQTYEDNSSCLIGEDLVDVIGNYPESLDVIEATIVAICGCNFKSLREHILEDEKEYFGEESGIITSTK